MAQWVKLSLGMLHMSEGSRWELQKPPRVNATGPLSHPSVPTVRWQLEKTQKLIGELAWGMQW